MGNLNKEIAFNRMPTASNETENKKENKNTRSPLSKKYMKGGFIFITKGNIFTAISFRKLENISKRRVARELKSLET